MTFYGVFLTYDDLLMADDLNVPRPKCAPVTETVSPVYLIHLTFSHTTSGSLKDGQPCSIDSLYQSVYLENRISISHNL